MLYCTVLINIAARRERAAWRRLVLCYGTFLEFFKIRISGDTQRLDHTTDDCCTSTAPRAITSREREGEIHQPGDPSRMGAARTHRVGLGGDAPEKQSHIYCRIWRSQRFGLKHRSRRQHPERNRPVHLHHVDCPPIALCRTSDNCEWDFRANFPRDGPGSSAGERLSSSWSGDVRESGLRQRATELINP